VAGGSAGVRVRLLDRARESAARQRADRIGAMSDREFVVLLPVKPPARGKSRLTVDPVRRRRLAAAFALDTARACLAAEHVTEVLAITDDAQFAAELRSAGCTTIPDGVADDLNGTLRQAAAEAHRRWPHAVPVAVCADLPALSPLDLDAALANAAVDGASFVADDDGAGTTLYTAPYDAFRPTFGPGSRAAHLASDAVPIEGLLATLRHDVDDSAALAAAETLGLGAHTRLAMTS
jgi:2-phospho-L-lactate/phosphoenolpyruvate guanylyltransferase